MRRIVLPCVLALGGCGPKSGEAPIAPSGPSEPAPSAATATSSAASAAPSASVEVVAADLGPLPPPASTWDGAPPAGGSCADRVAKWQADVEALDLDNVRAELPAGFVPIVSADGATPPGGIVVAVAPSGFFVGSDRVDGDVKAVVDRVRAKLEHMRRYQPTVVVVVAPSRDAGATLVLDVLAASVDAGLPTYLVAQKKGAARVGRGSVDAAIGPNDKDRNAQIQAVVRGLRAAFGGCPRALEAFGSVGAADPAAKSRLIADLVPRALVTDRCACDVASGLRLTAALVAGDTPVIGKRIRARPPESVRAQAKSASAVYQALATDGPP